MSIPLSRSLEQRFPRGCVSTQRPVSADSSFTFISDGVEQQKFASEKLTALYTRTFQVIAVDQVVELFLIERPLKSFIPSVGADCQETLNVPYSHSLSDFFFFQPWMIDHPRKAPEPPNI